MCEDPMVRWAEEEFGQADLGDKRREARLLSMAVQAARRSSGTITQTFDDAAAREAAFRFVESDSFSHRDVLRPARVAAAKRAGEFPYVYVAADASAVRVADSSATHFGPLSEKAKSTGAQVMTALVISPQGVPLGLAAQEFWTRSTEKAPDYKHDRRPTEERETQFWLDVLRGASAVLSEHAPDTMPWVQLDRGADCAPVLVEASQLPIAFTVRACYDRRLVGGEKLFGTLATRDALGTYGLDVRKQAGRIKREAEIEVRACPVTLELRLGINGGGPVVTLQLWAVEAREIGVPEGDEPITWRLLTNHEVASFTDAKAVIEGYTMRWRIEDFHLAWKTGACCIESSRLRDLEHFAKWATILATVAVRAERLKMLSRETPETPALEEFSRDEIDAVIALRKPKGIAIGATPSLGQVVRWIADIGGYTGKSSGGPPGVRIISRALIEVEAAAQAIAFMRQKRT